MMETFFKSTKPEKSPFDARCADKLLHVIKKHGKVKTRYSRTAWARVFYQLRKNGVEKPRILAALNFVCKTFGQVYSPVICSATAFQRKFLQIEAAMRRRPVVENHDICAVALQIRDDLDLVWPGKESEQEPRFTTVCLLNYDRFLTRLYFLKAHDGSDLGPFAEYILSVAQQDHEEFTVAWLKRVHTLAWEWEKWRGDLMGWIWRPDHPWFQEWVRKTVIPGWDHNQTDWEHLLKFLARSDNEKDGIPENLFKG